MTTSWTFTTENETQTAALGAALGRLLPARFVMTLDGDLGAGKTRFVQGLATAAGIDRRAVVSPTFALVNEYHGMLADQPRLVYHFDAYRVQGEQEWLDLGWEDYLAAEAWCVVEWSDRVRGCLPGERLEVRIRAASETVRELQFIPHGDEAARIVERLAISTSSGTSRGPS